MISNLKPFVKAGWYCVPLKGKLERDDNGKKTIPRFEEDWKIKYAMEQYQGEAKLGGVLTGELSGLLAIDCDNKDTYDMFKALDPNNPAVLVSKGKDAGTFLYKFTPDILTSFSLADNSIALDVYSNNGFIYLPTEANKTKHTWDSIPEIPEIPATVLLLLKQLKALKEKPVVKPNDDRDVTMALQPLVAQFVASKEFAPGLFRIITPKDFRDEEEYIRYGYLHPKNVPEGRGSEYLSCISAILGADKSINSDLYIAAMHLVNSLWSDPMDEDRMDRTICDPMISGKANIDGVSIWRYDDQWRANRLVLNTKRQSSLELGFDDKRNCYYAVDLAAESVKQFPRDNDLQSYIDAACLTPPKKAEMKRSLPILNVMADPSRTFGFHGETVVRDLNTFIQTPELAILRNPDMYRELYQVPETTLRYLQSLVPEEHMRNYLLRFLKRKLTTFEYSPVILYFMGVHGSGKDTLVNILEIIMGKVARPTVREFLEMFNGWLLDSYFVQLDEYGNQLNKLSDKEEALGKLKTYSGKQNVQIRQMRTDGFTYHHNATFIMTANKNPLMLEDGDRRIAFFPTPNILTQQDWVHDISEVHTQIMKETQDFCYYLATQIEPLSPAEYVMPPESHEKMKLIADSMFAAQRIAFAMKNNMIDYLKELCVEFEAHKALEGFKTGVLTDDKLEELYDNMTDMKGEMRTLNKQIRGAGIEIVPTTAGGVKRYKYKIFEESPFEKTSDNQDS